MQKVLFILGQLNDDDVEWLIKEGVRQKFEKEARLLAEGEANADLFMLLEGRVSVAVGDRGEVRVLGSGEMVGEMSLDDARPSSATVTALEDCYVLRISHQRLRARAASDRGFGTRFGRALASVRAQPPRRERRPAFSEETGLVEDEEQEAELGLEVLDNIHVAGARFDRLVKRLMGERSDQA